MVGGGGRETSGTSDLGNKAMSLIARCARFRAGVLAWCLAAAAGQVAWGGPNLVAIGTYSDVPFKRAEGRDSFSGKEIVYSFDEPEFDFGRVIVRSNQPNSVVRRDLFVGFTGESLLVSTQPEASRSGAGAGGGSNVQIQELEFWLRVNGKIKPGATYEWEVEGGGPQEIQGGVPAIIPAMWADGEQVGAEVTMKTPEPEETDRIQRLLIPHGVVTMKQFETQNGGAWIIVKPANYGAFFGIERFSFREVETEAPSAADSTMPMPVRYVPIRSVLEDEIAAVLDRSAQALRRAKSEDGTWGGGTEVEPRVSTTALITSALAELDPSAEEVKQAMNWLGQQAPAQGKPWSLETTCQRLYCLTRHGGLAEFGPAIQSDVQAIVNAQAADGGWALGPVSHEGVAAPPPVGSSSHDSSFFALAALREARFAGAEPDKAVWKRAMQYWTDAQVFDGGFSHKLERYGGVGQAPTSAYTATGAASLLTCIDMSAAIGNKRCSAYLAAAEQLRGVTRALDWLDKNFRELFKNLGSLIVQDDPYREADRMQLIGSVSGIAHFNKKNHFEEGARELLRHYDRASGLFGVRGEGEQFAQAPNLQRTAAALSILGAGAAPPVCQRIIVGDAENNWGQYRGDAQHLVRYLASKRGRQFNWRRTTMDREVRELVESPILVLSVVGSLSWSQEQWDKVREYAMAGGSIVIDIVDDAQAQRETVLAAIKKTFPEYPLAELPADAPVLTQEKEHAKVNGMQALSNGFRWFLFLPKENWTCQWHLNQVPDHEESFTFMNNLLTYATEGTPPRSSFLSSTYAQTSVPSKSMSAARIQIGSATPAYPNLIATMDRLMRSNFRLEVSEAAEPRNADLLWVNVTGAQAPSATDQMALLEAISVGKFVLIDVVSGNKDWDEGFRATLKGLKEGITLEPMRRTDPLYTGEHSGTQGFDAVKVSFRKALQTRFTKAGRCDLHAIYLNGKQVGVYSAYDLSSGIGYHYFPGCRGVAPQHARELVMNAFLAAYDAKVNPASRGAARGAKR